MGWGGGRKHWLELGNEGGSLYRRGVRTPLFAAGATCRGPHGATPRAVFPDWVSLWPFKQVLVTIVLLETSSIRFPDFSEILEAQHRAGSVCPAPCAEGDETDLSAAPASRWFF